MIYHKTDMRKMLDTIIDADIKLHRYMQYLKRQASITLTVAEKNCYMRDVKKICEIVDNLDKMYDDLSYIYYDMDDKSVCYFDYV